MRTYGLRRMGRRGESVEFNLNCVGISLRTIREKIGAKRVSERVEAFTVEVGRKRA